MAALILKSGNALNNNVESLDYAAYRDRVLADGGMIVNEQAVRDAMAFVQAQGIGQSEVFSATSADWGIRLLSGAPNKLYSLFGDAGDLDAIIGGAGLLNYNDTRYTHPVIEFKGHFGSSNALVSKGVANNVTSVGLCVISKVPVLASAGDYGTTTSVGGVAEVADFSNSATAEEGLSKKILSIYQTRPTASDMPNLWYDSLYGYAGSAIATTKTTSPDLTKWRTSSTLLTSSKLEVYVNGVVSVADTTVTPTAITDNLKLNVGRTRSGGAALAYQNPLWGDVAEIWCMVNTTEATMKSLSVRAAAKYID